MMSDMENKDWINDYMSLKQINTNNPFTVPEGYFDDLGDRIASFKNLDKLKNNKVTAGFEVPENYFNELAGNIQSRIAIEGAINNEDAGFVIPPDYFLSLPEHINSRIMVEEALNGSAEHLTVPVDYFNQLNKSILNKTTNRKTIIVKLFASTAFKYATAACFALLIGGGILLNQLGSPADAHKNSFLHKQLSNVPLNDIESYLQLNEDAGDTQQNVATEGAPVDDGKLKDALKNYADSVQ